MEQYQGAYSRSIRALVDAVHVSEQSAYEMIRMTALLMDLSLDDEKVVEIILHDCGVA